MSNRPPQRARFAIRLGARAAVVAGAYGLAAAAVLGMVFLLRGVVPPASLQAFLGFVFIATLAAGLEPGTVKADTLRGEARSDIRGMLAASALKALIASPVVALVWRFADPAVAWASLAWAPGVCVAGFCVTDLRVLLDLRGRHALAIGLKQGSLAGGLVLAGAMIALGARLPTAIGVSTLARLALVIFAARAERGGPGEGGLGRAVWRRLTDSRWADLAAVSLIAAVSGSADRVFGLRFLAPADYGAYYLVYEVFSKFWLIPYVLAPIVFARQAGGEDTGAFLRGAWAFIGAVGAIFLAVIAALLAFAPAQMARVFGAPFGLAILAFGAGVVVGSLGQIRIAALQGAGHARRAAVVTGLTALFSVALFYVAARQFGAPGLLGACLIKAVVELAAAMLPAGPDRAAAPAAP